VTYGELSWSAHKSRLTRLPEKWISPHSVRLRDDDGLCHLRHYGGLANPSAKERDLNRKRGGCDQAVEVKAVTFTTSSIQLELRNIGTPIIRNKSKGCEISPDEYSLRVTEFDQGQPREQAENAIRDVLQTPEEYLAAYGVTLNLPSATGTNQSPVEFPGPGLTAPKPVLMVQPNYSDANRNARLQGIVTVRCIIGTDGLVHAPVVGKGLTDELNKLALEALTFWRLEPVRLGTESVAAKIPLEFSFRMY
jgi:TonB family protein